MSPILFWFEQRGLDLVNAIGSRTDNAGLLLLARGARLQRRLDLFWHAFGPGRHRIQRSEYVAVRLLIGKALGVRTAVPLLFGDAERRPLPGRGLGGAPGLTRAQFQGRVLRLAGRYAASAGGRDCCRFLDVLATRVLRQAQLSYRTLAQVRAPMPLSGGGGPQRRPRMSRAVSAPILGRTDDDEYDAEPMTLKAAAAVQAKEFAVPWMSSADPTPTETGFRGWARSTKAAPVRVLDRPTTAKQCRTPDMAPIDLIGFRTQQIRIDAVALKQRPRSASVLSRSNQQRAGHGPAANVTYWPNRSLSLQSCQVKLSY
jgi:hypothetical protein